MFVGLLGDGSPTPDLLFDVDKERVYQDGDKERVYQDGDKERGYQDGASNWKQILHTRRLEFLCNVPS